jgi:DNA-binding beta-propeller fold protein YncE
MLSALIILGQLQVAAPPSPRRTVYVASEAVDLVSRVHFGPAGATVETVITVDPRPSENDGPHNLNISPDGEFAWVANFNLYGDMVPSSVSVVYTPAMQEVARIPTCLMPHGMRVAPDGSRAWMTCMMDDKVVELDPGTYGITRVLLVKPGGERVLEASRAMQPGELDQQHGHMSHDAPAAGAASSCAPTWGQPTADGQRLYVACNRHAEVLEVDAGTLTILRWIATGKTPYNLAISIDGRTLLATLGGGAGPVRH